MRSTAAVARSAEDGVGPKDGGGRARTEFESSGLGAAFEDSAVKLASARAVERRTVHGKRSPLTNKTKSKLQTGSEIQGLSS